MYIRENRFRLVLEDLGIPDTSRSLQMNEDFLSRLPGKSGLIDGAKELLDFAADQGYLLSIISNGFIKVQESKLLSSGIRHYFEHVVTHETAMANKPDPRIFHYAMSLTGADTGNSLMVGDSWNADVMGARSVGMDAAFFDPALTRPAGPVTYHIPALADLKVFL